MNNLALDLVDNDIADAERTKRVADKFYSSDGWSGDEGTPCGDVVIDAS